MKNEQKNIDPEKAKVWIKVFIAILSAIAGALGEASTNFINNLNLL